MENIFGNISHYYYVQNKGLPIPTNKDQVRWNNDLHELKYEEIVTFSPESYFKHPDAISFPLRTTYPGLLLGAGYAHPAIEKPDKEKNIEGDYHLGFFFDHTTGLPVIPGTSVKGVLKSVFPSEIKSSFNDEKKKEVIEKNELKLKYVNSIINEKKYNFKVIEENWKKVFFERKQVFLDAYLTNVDDNITVVYPKDSGKKDKVGKPIMTDDPQIEAHLFAEDYITPHGNDIFKEPTPIRFLKVASEVTFTFQFLLKDYSDSDGTITKEQIAELFKQIILDFGIGAKRNVGYGQFIATD